VFLQRLFAPRPALTAGRTLFAAAARQARQPAFYQGLAVADSVEGRFELYSLHVALLVLRLKGQGPRASETAQHLFDAYVKSLDDALREMGVSDVTVGKKMRKLGAAFYGRMRSYEQAVEALPEALPLEELLVRTVFEGRSASLSGPLAAYVARAAEALEGQPLAELLEGRVDWPEVSRV
jgi:cytochrome b pre-mRNA-processing protein 3